MQLTDILAAKYSEDRLHNLYLLTGNTVTEQAELMSWTKEFIDKCLATHQRQASMSNHQDILVLSPTPEKKNYLIDEISQIISFLNFKPLELKRKMVIIPAAEALSEIAINKLLKSWEEPQVPCTFFILNPYQVNLIPTLLSRSIQLRVPISQTSPEPIEDFNELCQLEYYEFCNMVQKKNYGINQLMRKTYDLAMRKESQINDFQALIAETEQLSKMQDFNSSQNSKLFLIFQIIQRFK